MNIAAIIPSKTVSNLIPCAEAVLQHDQTVRIIVVDDGVERTAAPIFTRVEWVDGVKPFIFARNVNVGIEHAMADEDCDGVVVLNDDAILQTHGGFTQLALTAQKFPEYGVVSATTNVTGNPNQFANKGDAIREEPRMVCFVAVYIPRTTLERVGLLDERYVDYGMDDDDYCLRVRQAGLKIAINPACHVDHGSLKSTYRGASAAGGDFQANLQRFREKWGHDNWGRTA